MIVRDLGTIDEEHAVRVHAVRAEDYSGDYNITVFVSGLPVIVVSDDDGDLDFSFLYATGPGNYGSAIYQTWASAIFHLGEVGEEDYQRYIDAVGTISEDAAFHTLLEYVDGHEICGLIDRVIAAFKDVRDEG